MSVVRLLSLTRWLSFFFFVLFFFALEFNRHRHKIKHVLVVFFVVYGCVLSFYVLVCIHVRVCVWVSECGFLFCHRVSTVCVACLRSVRHKDRACALRSSIIICRNTRIRTHTLCLSHHTHTHNPLTRRIKTITIYSTLIIFISRVYSSNLSLLSINIYNTVERHRTFTQKGYKHKTITI